MKESNLYDNERIKTNLEVFKSAISKEQFTIENNTLK